MKATAAFSGFSVNDQDKAKDFYTNTLGLKLINGDMGLRFELPGHSGEVFIYAKDDHQPASFTVLNLVVEDIDEAVSDLKAKGVEFEHYEGMTDADGIARGTQVNMGPDIAWFKDPAGNILSVLREG